MKKTLLFSLILLIAVTVDIVSNVKHKITDTSLTLVENYEAEWGLIIPTPEEVQNIWSTKEPSHGDGEWIKALLYKEVLPLEQFTVITNDNIEQVQSYITTFITNTKNVYPSNERADFLEVINQNSLKIETNYYYYHQSKNDGFDTLTVIYNKAENKVYTFEWHQ